MSKVHLGRTGRCPTAASNETRRDKVVNSLSNQLIVNGMNAGATPAKIQKCQSLIKANIHRFIARRLLASESNCSISRGYLNMATPIS